MVNILAHSEQMGYLGKLTSKVVKILIFGVGLMIAVGLCLDEAHAKNVDQNENKDDIVKITMSAAGDFTLGVDSRYNSVFNSYYGRHGSAYFLKKVKHVFMNDDITFVNFEGTLTTAKMPAIKEFTFKGPSKHVRILTKGSVEVVNLANNHSMDYLSKGYRDTTRTLKANNIPYCNNSKIVYKKVKGVKMAFLGFNALNWVTKSQVKAGIRRAQKNKAKIIVVNFHWGIERTYRPTQSQKSLAHYALDCGASVVLGEHPHVLQGVEKYKGRFIVYSMGNFCYGGHTNPSDKDTMIFQQTFTMKNGKLLKDKNARIIPCSISSSTYINNFQPRVLKGSSKTRLIKKMRRISSGMHVKIGSNGKLS